MEYSEKSFSIQANNFEKAILSFYTDAKNGIEVAKEHFSVRIKANDSLRNREFIIDFLKKNPSVVSVGIFQGKNEIVGRKENSSYVYALDTTIETGVVKWQRFENGKLSSSWLESMDISVVETEWYASLINDLDQLRWHVGNRVKTNPDQDDNNEFFYTGYSFKTEAENTVVLMEYSREDLLKGFDLISNHVKPLIKIKDLRGKEFNLTMRKRDSADQDTEKDSLQHQIDQHFLNFNDIPNGIFNFKFDNDIYWNSFKRLSKESGLAYYIFTIPNSDLHAVYESYTGGIRFWLGIGLMATGLILLFVRKRFFYQPNRMKIPPLQKILEDDENRFLEFKSSLRWDYRQEKTNPELEKVILKSLAAFGNTDGGILLIGVDDDKNILGLENDFQTLKKKNPDYYEVHLRNLLHNMMGVKYVSQNIRTKFEEIDQKWVCIIKVLSADEPLYLKYKDKNGQQIEKFYVRSGNSSHEIKSIAEINDYINKKFK